MTEPRGWEQARGTTSLSADVVVVGSGPGGAGVARALAARGAKVVVLEEGPPRPKFQVNQLQTQRYHMQEGGAMVARGSLVFPIAAGRGVGGGSLVNSAITLRTPDHVLEGWVELLGDDRFGPAAMKPVFDEIETRIQAGPTPEDIAGENNLLIVRGARKLGLKAGLLPRNTPHCQGYGVCNFGCPVGGKASVDRNLIVDARTDGAVVQADVKVDRILVEGGRAVGVSGAVRHTDTRDEVGRITVRADRVVLAAGAIGTPRLLHHARIAHRLGRAVGQGLHVHPGSAVLGVFDREINMWKGATQAAFYEDPALPGMLPHTFTPPPGVLYVMLGKVGLENKAVPELLPRLGGCLVMISDHGHGTVGATSDGRADITYTYASDDVRRIKEGLVRTAEVLFAAGAVEVTAPVFRAGMHREVGSFRDAVMPRGLWDFTTYASHPMATCRMGLDPDRSVIGPTGEAHRMRGLYLADSSIFPTSLGVNPQLTTMAMGTVIGRRMALA